VNKKRLVFEVADGVTTPEAVLSAWIELRRTMFLYWSLKSGRLPLKSLWVELPEMLDVPRVGDF